MAVAAIGRKAENGRAAENDRETDREQGQYLFTIPTDYFYFYHM